MILILAPTFEQACALRSSREELSGAVVATAFPRSYRHRAERLLVVDREHLTEETLRRLASYPGAEDVPT
jgi:hypothetical protein